ncbi:MAG TPA: hydrolase 1, exosortase A system-associated, partial [Polyangiaceae bacterium]|nr:hydrolase 1, exosortase A system-associated [Polyangiaceae bacterium]
FTRTVPSLRGIVLWGLCDGASAVLMNCQVDTRVCGVIVANPWVRTQASEAQTYLKHYYGARFFQRSFWSKVIKGGVNPFAILRELAAKLRTARGSDVGGDPATSYIERMRRGLAGFKGPTLVLISGHDLTAKEFMDLAAAPDWQSVLHRPSVHIVELKDADHTFSQRAVLDAAIEQCRRALLRLVPQLGSSGA